MMAARQKVLALMVSIPILCLPARISAFTVDEFTSTATFTLDPSNGAIILYPADGRSDGAVQVNYTIGESDYVQFGTGYSPMDMPLRKINAFRFQYRASGQPSTMEFKFEDSDSDTSADKLVYKFSAVMDDQWRTMNIEFSSFTLEGSGNNSFDAAKVRVLEIIVTPANNSGQKGTIHIDKLELYRSTFALVDDFEDGKDPDFLEGNSASFGGAPNATRTYVVDNGRKVMSYEYNVTGGGDAFLVLSLNNRNFQGYTHLNFQIRGNTGSEKLKLKLESAAGQGIVSLSDYLQTSTSITTEYQNVFVPLSAAGMSPANISKLTNFTLHAENAFGSGSGKVYIDNVAFVRKDENPGAVLMFDDMDYDLGLSNWSNLKGDGADGSVRKVSDASIPDSLPSNQVYRLDYQFSPSGNQAWFAFKRPFSISLLPFEFLNLTYKGHGGNQHIQVKFENNSKDIWFKTLRQSTDTGNLWRTAKISMKELAPISSNTTGLNLREIKRITVALLRASSNRSGIVAFDTLNAPESGASGVERPGGLIRDIRTINNPFSPDGNGNKDEVIISYDLESAGKVNLRIYDMAGREIRLVANEEQSAGENRLIWDGYDEDKARVANGLYLFRMEATSMDGRNDQFHQAVVVLPE